MKLLKSKNGKFNFDPSKAGTLITSAILLVVALKVAASTLPTIGEAGNEVSMGSGNSTHFVTYPLADLFQSDSILMLVIVGAILIGIVLQVIPQTKGK